MDHGLGDPSKSPPRTRHDYFPSSFPSLLAFETDPPGYWQTLHALTRTNTAYTECGVIGR